MSFIRELHQQLIRKERSAVEITEESLERVQALEPQLHSFLCITADRALEQARQVDTQIAAGEAIGMLAGIPFGIKDNMCTKVSQRPARLKFCRTSSRRTNRP